MKWLKSPEELVRRFDSAVASFEKAERRKMFGYPCIFLKGHLTAGLFQDRLMLRLSEQDRAMFLKLPGARPFEPMPGRPMREYAEAPPSVVSDPEALRGWLRRSVAFVETLQPKVRKVGGGGKRGAKKKSKAP
jgi:TfoX/Sxy family transcriptional regulator of competence genes